MNEVTCHFIHRPLRSHRKGAVQIGLFVFSYIFYHQRNEVEEKAHKAPFH